ncbi:sulfite exporter TauE/SafE family protein [Mycolicibacterium sp.]|uniref:sulfite exporter TauE/SafE family protein n=1 Tax=Mycolicibacterium sp. TaxID=2320850 RepID=UPI0037CB71F0
MTSSLPLLFGVGVVSGVTTVLFGFGGGFVTVPAVYLATRGGDMHAAVATSTAVMIVNSGLATLDSARRHRILAQYLWPMALFIAAGAALGAYAALSAPERLLHWLFVAYLAVTIVDCLARRGFLSRQAGDSAPHELTRAESTLGGLLVGFVASFLGVGGSVMTVPFLRRKGADMAGATATANPLSLPVALCGSVVYASMGPAASSPGLVGHVNFAAGTALLAGSLPIITIVRRALTRRAIPDAVHAAMYVALLGAVLLLMAVIR